MAECDPVPVLTGATGSPTALGAGDVGMQCAHLLLLTGGLCSLALPMLATKPAVFLWPAGGSREKKKLLKALACSHAVHRDAVFLRNCKPLGDRKYHVILLSPASGPQQPEPGDFLNSLLCCSLLVLVFSILFHILFHAFMHHKQQESKFVLRPFLLLFVKLGYCFPEIERTFVKHPAQH